MPCFSQIINTNMSVVENIIKAAKEFGWQFDIGENDNYIVIQAGGVNINLTRGDTSENFKTSTRKKEYLAVLQRQYNVVRLKNWADQLGYEVKQETKEKVKI